MMRSKHKNRLCTMSYLFVLHLLCGIFYFTVPLCSAVNDTREHQKLYQKLFNVTRYDKFPPLLTRGKPVRVEFGFNLINIVEVNAKKQFIKVHGWINHKWYNPLFTWNPDDYNGLETLQVTPDLIWVPDILLYNNLDEQDRVGGGVSTYKTHIVLNSNGNNTWGSPALFKSFCRIQVGYFPLDTQNCVLKFGSWTHDNRTIDLHPMDLSFPTEFYTKNGEWSVFNMSLYREQKIYPCSSNYAFSHVSLAIHISREAFDYLINLIVPCCLISSMIFLGFILPPESGERIGLSITVLLAMTVFQQLTSEIMPAYDFPILGQYYFAIVLEISASLVATTLILNFYHRTNRKMPYWIKKVLLHWSSRLVLLHDEVLKKCPKNKKSSTEAGKTHKTQPHNDSNKQPSKRPSQRKQSEATTGLSAAGYDRCYGDNIFGNEQALDKEGVEMRGLPRVNTYPFINMGSIDIMDEREKERNQDISEEELQVRHWEWTLGARILDRCVLIVAVLIGFITVMAVFLRAPSLWNDHTELDVANPIRIAQNINP